MTNKMRYEVIVEEDGDFHETCNAVEQRLRDVPRVQDVKLLVAVGGFVSNQKQTAEGEE